MAEFRVTKDGYVLCWAAGWRSSPGEKGDVPPSAGIGVFFNDDHPRNLKRSVPLAGVFEPAEVEVTALTEALVIIKSSGFTKVELRSDAFDVINAAMLKQSKSTDQEDPDPVWQELLQAAAGLDVKFASADAADDQGIRMARKLAKEGAVI